MAITMMNFAIDPITTTLPRGDSAATMMNQDIKDEQVSGCKRPLNESCCNNTEEEQPQPQKKQRTTKAKKRVSFGHQYVHEVSRIEDADAPQVWYSSSEFVHSRRCDGHWVNFYTRCDDSYRQELFKVLGAACGKMAPTRQPLVALAEHQCRGLEREMTPCFRQRKKQVVANVLQSQSALQAWRDAASEKELQADKGAEILAAHYHKLTLPATRFARLLAQGDAMIAVSSSQR